MAGFFYFEARISELEANLMTLLTYILPVLIQTFSFQPTITKWVCPKGARYVLIECQPIEVKMPTVSLKLDSVADDSAFFQGSWESEASEIGAFSSVIVTSFVHDLEGPVLLISLGVGFDGDSARHAGVFMDVAQSGVPKQLMITGDRLPLNEKQEVVLTFEMSSITSQ